MYINFLGMALIYKKKLIFWYLKQCCGAASFRRLIKLWVSQFWRLRLLQQIKKFKQKIIFFISLWVILIREVQIKSFWVIKTCYLHSKLFRNIELKKAEWFNLRKTHSFEQGFGAGLFWGGSGSGNFLPGAGSGSWWKRTYLMLEFF